MLERTISKKLEAWLKEAQATGKALLVTGARQVGKSFSIREFGRTNFDSYIEFNLFENQTARDALVSARDTRQFIERVSILSGAQMPVGHTLIFIDEIQEAPDLMTRVKFLVEDGRFTWAFSGSMLGSEFKGVRSYPVGYVREETMVPLGFEEFCKAAGVSAQAMEQVRQACVTGHTVEGYIHDSMMDVFRSYLVVGGMPEVVQRYVDTRGDFASLRLLQEGLNRQYRFDISKYAGARALHAQDIFDRIPLQLNAKNRRFVLSSLQDDARYDRYARDFLWLVNAGVALKADLTTDTPPPLKNSQKPASFKLYQSDTGMLMQRYPASVAQAAYLGQPHANLGAVYENAVAQELAFQERTLYYYQTKKRGEIDFLIESNGADIGTGLVGMENSTDDTSGGEGTMGVEGGEGASNVMEAERGFGGGVIPIEVKSGNYYHAHASLDSLLEMKSPSLDMGIVFCKGNIEREGKVLYLPLYAIFCLSDILRENNIADFRMAMPRI